MQGVRSISSPIGQEYYAYGYLSTDMSMPESSCLFFFFSFNNLLHGTRGQTVVATFVTTYNRRTPNMELKKEKKKKRKEKRKEEGKRKERKEKEKRN